MANVKNITDLPIAESTEGLNLIVNDNGAAKQIAASAVGGGGIFIIDSTADDFNMTDSVYGNTIKDALLDGKTVYYYDGTGYFSIVAFGIKESTTGEVTLNVYTAYSTTNGNIGVYSKSYTFAITL